MRIICTFNNRDAGVEFSAFLTSKKIENQLEIVTNTDWGSSEYGNTSSRIWVYDEDQVSEALNWLESFQKGELKESIEKLPKKVIGIGPTEIFDKETSSHDRGFKQQEPPKGRGKTFSMSMKKSQFSITTYLFLICFIFFFVDTISTPNITSIPGNLPVEPFIASPIKKETFYDYPQAYEIVDKAIKLYGYEAIETPQDLPSEGKYLLKEYQKTPYWHGFYGQLLTLPINEVAINAPVFEKIREGEIWRLFTPCLMHNDILHILFNMLWLFVLGKQIEQRLSPRRYLLMILLAGVFSNTCQYLMSGPDFLGFSGVLCAMLTFIWVRQRIAPWEGYPLEKSTITFMMAFIFIMSAIQVSSFYLESYYQMSVSPGIANTAHLSGAFIGACLGRLPFFTWKT